MQDPKYAGKYGVEQQLKLLSKWLAETGFGEAAVLVSAAALSVADARHKKPPTQLQNRGAPTASDAVQELAVAHDEAMIKVKRRA